MRQDIRSKAAPVRIASKYIEVAPGIELHYLEAGQGAPMIAAIWGIFIWKEFKGSKKPVGGLLALMFVFFIAGLALIVMAR